MTKENPNETQIGEETEAIAEPIIGNPKLLKGLRKETKIARLRILSGSVNGFWSAISKNDLEHCTELEKKQILGEL